MLYEEDLFHPINDTEHNLMDYNKNKDLLSEIKKMDKNYYKVNRVVNKQWPDGKYSKKVNIELYTSGDSGSYIRNAVTGQKYKYKVGSKNEDLLFKTKVCIEGLHYSNSLFYDSPEQFEKHFFVTVNGETKETWYSKNLDARRE